MVMIESLIKTNLNGQWHIVLWERGNKESPEICINMQDYTKKLAAIRAKYTEEIEVNWSWDEGVTEAQVNAVHMEMMVYETEIETQKNKQMEG